MLCIFHLFFKTLCEYSMKNRSFGFIWFGFFFSACLSLAHADKYLFDEETDGILLNCAIAFLVLCSIFLILVIIFSMVIYRRSKDRNPRSRKGYQVSYREDEPVAQSISGPFYGHGIYSYRPESSIYLPGRQSTYIYNNPAKDAVYENEGVDLGEGGKRDSPPQEKGQQDAKMSEKTTKMKTTYDNPAFENPGYGDMGRHDHEALDHDGHDYEMLDLSAPAKRE